MIWYALIGFLLLNGLPHFAAGAAGLRFRLFLRDAAPARVGVLWGLANFVVALILVTWRLSLGAPSSRDMIALLVGGALAYVMFGLAAPWFYAALTNRELPPKA